MIKETKSIGFVCMANYCRSPVAKMILKNKFKHSLSVDSAGINPMVSAGMDPRSVDYLKQNNIVIEMHNPKKIDKNFLNSSDVIFAMDVMILMHLNNTYKNFRHKFKLFTHQQRNLQIKDPYRLPEEEYRIVMDEINYVVDRFELEELC